MLSQTLRLASEATNVHGPEATMRTVPLCDCPASASPCPQRGGHESARCSDEEGDTGQTESDENEEAASSNGDEETSSSDDDEEPEVPPMRLRFDKYEEDYGFNSPTRGAKAARKMGIAAPPKSRRNLSSVSSSGKTTTVEVRSSISVPSKRKASPPQRFSMTRVVEHDKLEPYDEDLLYSPILGNPLHTHTDRLRPWLIPKPSDIPGPKPSPPTSPQPPVTKPCGICNAPHIEAHYMYHPCGHQACKWCFYTAWEWAQISASALFNDKVPEMSADVPCGICKAVVDELIIEAKGERWIVAGKTPRPAVRLGSAKRRKCNP
jgi:hypothetical protein